MKLATLLFSLLGVATVLPAQAGTDGIDWSRAELVFNAEYDEYVAVPTLSEDLFQERLVWSPHYTDFVPVAMAYEAELRDYQERVVWSETHADFVPRAMIEPCPRMSKLS